MKVIVVVLILIQISFIVPYPINRIESKKKESKVISRNLSNKRRLGVWNWIKNVGGSAVDKVTKSTPVSKIVAKNVFDYVEKKAKNIFNKVSTKVKSNVKTLAKLVDNELFPQPFKTFCVFTSKVKSSFGIGLTSI